MIAGKTHIGPRPVFPFEYLADSNIMPPGKNHVLWTDLNTARGRRPAGRARSTPAAVPGGLLALAARLLAGQRRLRPAGDQAPALSAGHARRRGSTRCRYYTDVSWMDKQVGEVRPALAKHGYADRTLFMFTADQGAQWPFAKWNLYDAGIRVAPAGALAGPRSRQAAPPGPWSA